MRILPSGTRRVQSKSNYVEAPYDDINTALCIEAKYKNSDDPFDDFEPENPNSIFEAPSSGARSTRGQLAMYADRQFQHQHRVFLFQVIIVGCWARLLYWDRSGAVVTKAFNLLVRPDILIKFLWRFAHATKQQQGWDCSVNLATREERRIFIDATHKFAEDGTMNVPAHAAMELARNSRDPSYPVCRIKVAVDSEAGPHSSNNVSLYQEFLICSPLHVTCATPGRGTRCYLAYDLCGGVFRFLKDTWWVSRSNRLSEMGIYSIFQERKMDHVLLPLCGGLVHDPSGNPQITTEQKWIAILGEDLAPRNAVTRRYEHGRLVQELACTLEGLRSSEELITVIRDVVKCE